MSHLLKLENIEALREQVGIVDIELENEIRRLQVGDHVKVTFLTSNGSFQSNTVLVRITSVQNSSYRGKLLEKIDVGKVALKRGTVVKFDHRHIHSITKIGSANRQ